MKRLKVIVCGNSSVQFNLESIKGHSDIFELVGILANESTYIRKCSEHYKVKVYSDIDNIPKDINFAYVVSEGNSLVEEKVKLSKKLLEKGIHVLHEQPILHKDIVECLKIAKQKNIVFTISDFNIHLKPISIFTKCIKTILEKQKVIYIDATLNKDKLYSFIHTLSKILPVFRPFEIRLINENIVAGKIGDIKLRLNIDNEDYYQYRERIIIGTEVGKISLSGTNGPIIWESYIPNVRQNFVFNSDEYPSYLFENNTEIIWKNDIKKYKDIFFNEWVEAITKDLENFHSLLIERYNISSQIQLELLCANYWSKLIALIPEKETVIFKKYNQFPTTLLKKVVGNELKQEDEKFILEYNHDISMWDNYANKLIEDIDEEYLSYCVKKRDETILNTMLNLFQSKGLFLVSNEIYSTRKVFKDMNVSAENEYILLRWLEVLCEKKYIKKLNDKYYGAKIISDELLKMSWKEVRYLWDYKLGSPLTTDYLLSNINKLPELISGKQSATLLLFPEGKLDYANALYKETLILKYLNNIIAEAVIDIGNKNNIFNKISKDSFKILEVGAGTGATTDIVTSRLKKRLNYQNLEYTFTDISTLFLENAKKRYKDFFNMKFKLLNIDKEFALQEVKYESVNIIISVGVLNNAYNTDKTIEYLLNSLSSNGWLFIIETVVEVPEILVSQAFMMTHPVDERLNKGTTFLSVKQWKEIFTKAGASEILEFPPDNHRLNMLGQKLFIVKK